MESYESHDDSVSILHRERRPWKSSCLEKFTNIAQLEIGFVLLLIIYSTNRNGA